MTETPEPAPVVMYAEMPDGTERLTIGMSPRHLEIVGLGGVFEICVAGIYVQLIKEADLRDALDEAPVAFKRQTQLLAWETE